MTIYTLILLVVLLAVTLFWVVIFVRVLQSYGKGELLEGAFGLFSQSGEGVGISLLGADVYDQDQIENLLLVDYPRYEVILALDSQHNPQKFEALVSRYHMIWVDYLFTGEFPPSNVRGLYRSRKRSFRRLVIVDHDRYMPWRAFDAAAGVASYDYLLPIGAGVQLTAGAIERLVVEVGEQSEPQIIIGCFGPLLRLFQRDVVTRKGGFGMRPWTRIARRSTKIICDPLLKDSYCALLPLRSWSLVWVAIFSAGVAWALYDELWVLLATLLTWVFVWVVIEAIAKLLGTPELRFGALFEAWRGDEYKKFRNS